MLPHSTISPSCRDRNPMADGSYRLQIVRNIEQRGTHITIQAGQHGKDFHLRHRIQCAGGLVSNEQRWRVHHGDSDQDSLRLSYADLRGVAALELFLVRKSDSCKRPSHGGTAFAATALGVSSPCFSKLCAYSQGRI